VLSVLKRSPSGADPRRMVSTVTAHGVAPADLDPVLDAEIEETRSRRREALRGRNLLSAVALGVPFVVLAVLLAVLLPTHRSVSVFVVLALILADAAAVRVEFEVGTGAAVATMLVLVPMLFVLPARIVPLCVAAGLILSDLPDVLRGRASLERGLLSLVSSWHALGPALVLGLAGEPSPTARHLPIYAAAVASQFGLDFASSAVRQRLVVGISPGRLLGFIRWAWMVDLALAPVGLAIAYAASHNVAAAFVVLPLIGLLGFFARERKTRIDHALELSHAYRGTALLLGDVVEADDAYTGSHSRDVVELVLAVCDDLDLPARARRDAEFVALLHDIGKIRIPAEIIHKPGPLDPEERAIINTHTLEGERLLAQIGGLLGQVGRVVRSCHERWDGGGYPDGLAGETIPRIARIVCACDAYSAITTSRPYRAARTPAEALEELQRGAGTQFDPQVIDALERVLSA
jgi:HD-GYP domain-containing protein (c-di-GMP phosphodiesterase class II)